MRKGTIRTLLSHGLSNILLSDIASSDGRGSLTSRMGAHCIFNRNQENGSLKSVEMLYLLRSFRDPSVAYTQYIRTPHHRTYFCINYSSKARTRLANQLKLLPQRLYREFSLDALAIDQCIRRWETIVEQNREILKDAVQHPQS